MRAVSVGQSINSVEVTQRKEAFPIPPRTFGCMAFNLAGASLLFGEVAFGLYMGIASTEAVKFFLRLAGGGSVWNIVAPYVTACLTVTGLLTGVGTALAAFNFPEILAEAKKGWDSTSEAHVSFCAKSVSLILNCALWGGLSMTAVLALTTYGFKLGSPEFIALGSFLFLGSFLDYFLIFIEDIASAPLNFNTLRTSPQFKDMLSHKGWLLDTFVNLSIKGARQGYIATSGISLLSGMEMKSGVMTVTWAAFFSIAVYETFFTQSYDRLRKIRLKKGLKLMPISAAPEAPLPIPVVEAPLSIRFSRLSEKILQAIHVSIQISLILSNMTFCGDRVSEEGSLKYLKLSVMLLAGVATALMTNPQTMAYLAPKIRGGSAYSRSLFMACKPGPRAPSAMELLQPVSSSPGPVFEEKEVPSGFLFRSLSAQPSSGGAFASIEVELSPRESLPVPSLI